MSIRCPVCGAAGEAACRSLDGQHRDHHLARQRLMIALSSSSLSIEVSDRIGDAVGNIARRVGASSLSVVFEWMIWQALRSCGVEVSCVVNRHTLGTWRRLDGLYGLAEPLAELPPIDPSRTAPRCSSGSGRYSDTSDGPKAASMRYVWLALLLGGHTGFTLWWLDPRDDPNGGYQLDYRGETINLGRSKVAALSVVDRLPVKEPLVAATEA